MSEKAPHEVGEFRRARCCFSPEDLGIEPDGEDAPRAEHPLIEGHDPELVRVPKRMRPLWRELLKQAWE